MSTVHAVVPDGIDDPARPTGGNVYDRHLFQGLTSLGWAVHEHAVPGFWRRPDVASFADLAGALGRIPDDSVVLIDGLVGSVAPEVLVPQSRRLRLVVLVHMPLGDGPDGAAQMGERAVLSAAAAVLTTSAWTRRRLLELYALPADRVHAAEPGVDPSELSAGTQSGGSLLCVAAVSVEKGHDLLLDALSTISDLPWQCECVGRLDGDPAFVETVRRRTAGNRVCFRGPLTGADLDRSYGAADVVVLASRAETYGMVLTEALARGVPVIAADTGGVREAVGHGVGGVVPGLLVPPDDAVALADALRAWLGDAELRERLRAAACSRRDALPEWSTTASVVAGVLAGALR